MSSFAASGLYVPTWIDILDTTQMAIDLDLETHKLALYTDTETPDFSTETVYSSTNEVSDAGGANYVAKGAAVTTTAVSESPTGTIMWDAADVSWTPVTFTAHGGKIHAAALTEELIVGITFGADYTATAGTFTVSWNPLGILTIDCTP